MKTGILYLTLLLVLFFGCNKTTDKSKIVIIDNFKCNTFVKGEQILKDNFDSNFSISSVDSLLLLKQQGKDIHYTIYNSKDLKYLGSLGVRGEGPNEWNVVFHNKQFEIDDNGIKLWFSRQRKGFLSQVNISKVIENKSPYPVVEKNLKINTNLFPFSHIIYLNSDKVIGNSGYYDVERVRLKSYNPKTRITEQRTELFPKIKNSNILPSPALYNLYFGQLQKHPSKDLFINAMRIFNRIDIFDEDLNLIKSIVSGDNWKDDYYDAAKIDVTTDYMADKVQGYGNLSVTENFILALETGKKRNALTNDVEESYVRVFDLEGKSLCRLSFHQDLFSIDLNEKSGFLYATDIQNEKVLQFNLEELIEKWKK